MGHHLHSVSNKVRLTGDSLFFVYVLLGFVFIHDLGCVAAQLLPPEEG